MSLSIRTNVASLNAQRNLFATQLSLDSSLSRLSSGFRITKAGDDAAGLGISTKLESQIRSYGQATRNANDGLSVVQTTEAALNEQANILTRMRELGMQSGSDGVGNSERGYIDTEAQKLLSELQRISQVTEYNGTKLLDGSAATLDFQVGIAATGNDRISLNTLNATTAAAGTPVAGAPFIAGPTSIVGTASTAAANDAFGLAVAGGSTLSNAVTPTMTAVLGVGGSNYDIFRAWNIYVTGFYAAGGVNGQQEVSGSPTPAQQAGLNLLVATRNGSTGSGTGSAELAAGFQAFAYALLGTNGDPYAALPIAQAGLATLAQQVGAAAAEEAYFAANPAAAGGGDLTSPGAVAGMAALGFTLSISPSTPGSSGGLGVAGLSLTTKASSLSALASIDAALATISSNRATLGATGNRLQSAIANIQSFSESLSAANSRIKDVDVAEETSRMSRSQILMQAGISVLAQANQMPQMALKLLG
jgi:flagellin